jgi:tetratricopeptide (TPR) repeat protein
MARPNNQWVGRNTTHFAIYTTDSQNREHEILARLDTARRFFEQTGWASRDANNRLEILAFGSSQEYDSYHFNPSAFAFYERTGQGDYIVMRDLDPDHYTVAVHEYTHFVVEHAGLNLPLWLNEGLADFYSTIESRKGQALLGLPPDGREDTLRSRRWIDWATLTTVERDSPYYQEPEKMLLFYSQSWALVHMLAMDPRYAAEFPKFLTAMSGGAAAGDAFAAVYHTSLPEVGAEVERYVAAKRLAPRLLNVDLRTAPLETQGIADAEKYAEFALADVLAADPQTAADAQSRLEALAVKYPGDPRPNESLGYLAMSAGSPKDAAQHFANAVRSNSQDPEVLFRLAHLKLKTEGPSEEVLDLLGRVLAKDSSHYNARLELGFAAAKTGNYGLAVQALEKISSPNPEHAYVVPYTLAYCLVELRQGNRARFYAQLAAKTAANGTDRQNAAGLLRYIDQETPVEVASQ